MPSSPPPPRGSSRRIAGPCPTARLLAEARCWFVFATRHGLDPDYAADKARSALALTMRLASSSREPDEVEHLSLLVPTKLVGVSSFQPALRQLAARGPAAGLPLRLAVQRGRVAAFATGAFADEVRKCSGPGSHLLGLVQTKHAWLAPLVAFGARAVLLQITGGSPDKPTYGVNLALTGLGEAILALKAKDTEGPASSVAVAPERRPAA